MAYISDIDITDEVVKQFLTQFSTYHSLVDNKLIDVGLSLGVDAGDFNLDDNGYISNWYIKQYLVCWFCMRLCLDKMGMNNVSISEMEKYAVKYNFYLKEADKMERQITKSMLIGDSGSTGSGLSDYKSSSNILFRG